MSDEDARRPTHGALAVDAGDAAAAADAGDAAAADADAGAGNASPQALLDMMRRLRARERGYLASLLHDGPIQELAAVALELGEVRRAMGAPPSDEPNGLVRQVHAIGHTLCRLQDELWPFPRPGSGLIETLKQRTAWLLATSLAVAVGEGVAELSEADVQNRGRRDRIDPGRAGQRGSVGPADRSGTSRPGPDLPRAEHDAGTVARSGLWRLSSGQGVAAPSGGGHPGPRGCRPRRPPPADMDGDTQVSRSPTARSRRGLTGGPIRGVSTPRGRSRSRAPSPPGPSR
jgi:hypothetical protein